MVDLVLTAVAATTAAASAALLLRRSRRLGRAGLAPAGVKHLAAHVSELSDARLHLPATRSLPRKPRLGALLGLR